MNDEWKNYFRVEHRSHQGWHVVDLERNELLYPAFSTEESATYFAKRYFEDKVEKLLEQHLTSYQ